MPTFPQRPMGLLHRNIDLAMGWTNKTYSLDYCRSSHPLMAKVLEESITRTVISAATTGSSISNVDRNVECNEYTHQTGPASSVKSKATRSGLNWIRVFSSPLFTGGLSRGLLLTKEPHLILSALGDSNSIKNSRHKGKTDPPETRQHLERPKVGILVKYQSRYMYKDSDCPVAMLTRHSFNAPSLVTL
jgi:hypothetical protein